MAASKKRKRRKKRKSRKVISINNYRIRLSLGVFIFVVIFLYMVICVGIYFTREKVSIYEVSVQGSLTKAQSYTGLILREESVTYAEGAGTVNYYVREGGRTRRGDTVYTLDESGRLSALLFSGSSTSLNESDLSDLKAELTSYCMSYDSLEFNRIYNMKIELDYEILELAESSNIASLDQIGQEENFIKGEAEEAGTVSYYIDGFEDYTADDIQMELFDTVYMKQTMKSGTLLEPGDAVYKTVTSDDWLLIFPISEEDMTAYQGKKSLNICIEKDGFELTGAFSTFVNESGTFGQLSIKNYMIRYLSERYLSFEIQDSVVTGLKIPKTALVEKSFYTIPKEYLTTDGENNSGFWVESYNSETQKQEITFLSPTVYSSDDTYYYINRDAFDTGTYLIQKETNSRYQIGTTASLKGVYCVNQGYTVFRLIEILTENDEYYIVQTGTRYGLSLYDYIILNSKTVSEGQVIYQ